MADTPSYEFITASSLEEFFNALGIQTTKCFDMKYRNTKTGATLLFGVEWDSVTGQISVQRGYCPPALEEHIEKHFKEYINKNSH